MVNSSPGATYRAVPGWPGAPLMTPMFSKVFPTPGPELVSWLATAGPDPTARPPASTAEAKKTDATRRIVRRSIHVLHSVGRLTRHLGTAELPRPQTRAAPSYGPGSGFGTEYEYCCRATV